MSYLTYKVCNNYNDYLQVCKSINNNILETQEWDDFFGVNLKYNEETGEYTETVEEYNGLVKYRPEENEYPLLVTYNFDNDWERFGALTIQMWDWISLNELDLERRENE